MCKKIAHYCKDTLTRLSFACIKVNVCKNNEDFAQFIWQLETFIITLRCTKKQNAMLLQEFSQLTGFTPSEDYYNEVINAAYMESDLDKVAWCKQWKRNGGVQAAYNEMAEELAMTKERLADYKRYYKNKCDACAELRKEMMDVQVKKLDLQCENLDLREEIKKCKEQVSRLNSREYYIDTLNKICN